MDDAQMNGSSAMQPTLQNEVPSHVSIHPPKHKKPLLMLFVMLGLAGSLGVVGLAFQKGQDIRGRAAMTGPILTLSPASKSALVGESITLGMALNTGDETVSSVELHLSYDPTALQVINFIPGTVLPVVLTPESHANGTISVVLGVQPTAPFKGATILGTWTVRVLSQKQSSILINPNSAVAAIGKITNVLTKATGSTIVGTMPAITTIPTPSSFPIATGIPTRILTPTRTISPTKTPTPTPATGCYYQQVKCFMPPCVPILICPTSTPIPTRPPPPTATPTRTPTVTPTVIPKPIRCNWWQDLWARWKNGRSCRNKYQNRN